MSVFKDRKDTFEKKFAHNEELMFKAEARTCKLLGLWAAEQMGLEGDAAKDYAQKVLKANMDDLRFEHATHKIMPDFIEKGLDISEYVINTQLEKLSEIAIKQIMEEEK